MPALRSFIFLFALAAFAAAYARAEPALVTLEQAARAAVAQEESVPTAEAQRDQADARVGQARAPFLPNVGFAAQYTRQDLPGNFARTWNTRLTASQSIFEGWRDAATYGSARASRRAFESNVEAARQAVYGLVAQLYFAILSGEREVDNLAKTIELAQDRSKEIRNRAKIGRSRDIELMAAQAQSAVLEAQLRAAEGQLRTDRQQFALTTGLAVDARLDEGTALPAPQPIEVYVGRIEERPDVIAAKESLTSFEKLVTSARAGHFPSVNLLGNYFLGRSNNSTSVVQRVSEWDIGVTLTFPIFTGGLVSAQVSEASARAREAELALHRTRREADIAIRTAYQQWVAANEQVTALESALTSTQKNYQEQARNFRFGQATNLDVIQALNSFQDTRRTLDRTRYSARAAQAQLLSATAQAPMNPPAGENP